MEKDEIDEDDYKEFLVGSSDEDDDDDAQNDNPDKIEEYRKRLLGSLNNSKGGKVDDIFRKRDLQ